ncbi:hypothetical protein [Acerihabitans arboris]|uniref:Uncharacterized protein n=1 Tax=Acerihabitans arboris TaxID=2691583 RepID=A0A845SLY7_9GAMM|nr:hypothetical protein [Acerihabitans arboris]NDL63588.1 hypothetical protein [Acerihabitans arboris]
MLDFQLSGITLHRNSITRHDECAEIKNGEEHCDQRIFNENIDFTKPIFQTKHCALQNAFHPPPEEDYLSLCVKGCVEDGSAHALRPTSYIHQVAASRNTRERGIFNFMLNHWLQLLKEDINDEIKKKLSSLVRLFLYEHEISHYSGSPAEHALPCAQQAVLPGELRPIVSAGNLIDRTLLDTLIYLLLKKDDTYHCTSSLIYKCQSKANLNALPKHLREAADKSLSLAQKKLGMLTIGQKLIIPLLTLNSEKEESCSPDGHFSAVLAVKKPQGFEFNIFDSNDPNEENKEKEILIDRLIETSSSNEIRYFGRQFQFNNDCAIHTYNFFRLCIYAPAQTVSSAENMHALLNNYIKNIERLNELLEGNTAATSQLLRILFVLDGIKSGYRQGLVDDPQLLCLIYGVDEPTGPDTVAINRSASLWQRLRRGSSLTSRPWKKRSTSDASAT